MIVNVPAGGSIMAVAAHPDDIESWCGGTLAQASEAGAHARLLLVTSGELGSSDPQATPAAVAQQREAEAREAATRLGLVEVAFLRYGDYVEISYVEISAGLERKIAARLAHTSQTPDATALAVHWRNRAARIGEPAGLAAAEAFTILALT